MNWEAIGAIGEVVGAAGVILTLVYLAFQIRQNTAQLEHAAKMARVSAQTTSNETLRENRQSIFETAEMAEIYHLGNLDPLELSDVQILRYRLVMQNVTEVMLEICTQSYTTNFSPEIWNTQGLSLVQRVLETPGGQWFWKEYQDNYTNSFRNEVDGILKEEAPNNRV